MPPTLEDLKTEPDKLKFFADSLIVNKSDIIHNTKLKRVIAASVLSYHQTLSAIIESKPAGEYKYSAHHTTSYKLFLFC